MVKIYQNYQFAKRFKMADRCGWDAVRTARNARMYFNDAAGAQPGALSPPEAPLP